MRPEHLHQLVPHDLDDLLTRRKRRQHLFAQCFHFYVFNELLDDFKVNISLQQRHPDLAQSFFHIGGRELAFAAQIFEDALELIGETIEHDSGTAAGIAAATIIAAPNTKTDPRPEGAVTNNLFHLRLLRLSLTRSRVRLRRSTPQFACQPDPRTRREASIRRAETNGPTPVCDGSQATAARSRRHRGALPRARLESAGRPRANHARAYCRDSGHPPRENHE